MIHVGSHSDPTIRTRLVLIFFAVPLAIYLLGSISTRDWHWWQGSISTIPQSIRVYCYGSSVEIDPGSSRFKAIHTIVNASLMDWKRWDSSSVTSAGLQEYQADPNAVVLELYYREPLRIHTSTRYYTNVDKLVIPLEGYYAQANAMLSQSQGDTVGASMLHITSTKALASYLSDQGICPAALRTSR